jgi:predicted HTH domain antitoxin
MRTIMIEIPDDQAHPAGASDEKVARDARLALTILWSDRGSISQGKGAELAGLTRVEFIDELGRANVSAIQTSVDELRDGDANRACAVSLRDQKLVFARRSPAFNRLDRPRSR